MQNRKIIKVGSEASEQQAVIKYLDAQYPQALYCASAGGMKASFMQAVRMKLTGYKRGFPDLFIYEPMRGYHGLAIEMKKDRTSYPSKEQKEWRDNLLKRGYLSFVCCGFEEAKKVIDNYFEVS